MAFAVISYLHLPLHSHLDPSPTEHFLLSSWNTHTILTQHSHDGALCLSTSFSLTYSLHIRPTLLLFTHESQTPVNPDEPSSFILKKRR